MQILFNRNTMQISTVCGILENYQPSEKIKEIFEKVEKLKEEMIKFQQEIAYPALQEIEQNIKEENEKFFVTVNEEKKD